VKQYPAAQAPRIVSRDRAKTLKPDLARVTAHARKAEQLSQREVANDAGTVHQVVSLWEKPLDPAAPSILHVVEMCHEARPVSIALIRWQADTVGGVQVIETPAVVDEPEPARSCRLIRACTNILRANAERCANDSVDADVLELEQRETDASIATLTEHRAYLVQTLARLRR
jgi:hypothetical protein